jgi:hypothetical protein
MVSVEGTKSVRTIGGDRAKYSLTQIGSNGSCRGA